MLVNQLPMPLAAQIPPPYGGGTENRLTWSDIGDVIESGFENVQNNWTAAGQNALAVAAYNQSVAEYLKNKAAQSSLNSQRLYGILLAVVIGAAVIIIASMAFKAFKK